MSFMNVSSITSGTLQANMIADIHEGSRRITEENKTNGKLPKDGITLKKKQRPDNNRQRKREITAHYASSEIQENGVRKIDRSQS